MVLVVSLIVLVGTLAALLTGTTTGWLRVGVVVVMFLAAVVAFPLIPVKEKFGRGVVAAATFVGLILAVLPLWPVTPEPPVPTPILTPTPPAPTTPTPSASPKAKRTPTAAPTTPASSPKEVPDPDPTAASSSTDPPEQKDAGAQAEVQLVNDWAQRCADVRGPTAKDGNPTQLFACDSSLPQQKWIWLASGQLKGYLGRCLTLDYPASRPPDAVPVVMRDCGDDLGQRWHQDKRGFLISDNEMCLDLVGPYSTDNTLLHGYTCDSDHYWDKWNVVKL